MPIYKVTRSVSAPSECIWRFVCDVTRWADLLETIDKVEPLDGAALTSGHRFRIEQPGLRPAIWEVTKVDPAEGFEWVSRAPGMVMTAGHRLTGADDGTSLLTLEFGFSGLLGTPAGYLFGAKTRDFLTREIDTFARLGEDAARGIT
ncbi:MAG: SRPBCC family protein [Notoacmeibacter sp.]|nr:SRPBCC family protein [Notoacmeibacter sp.]MCC0033088.1 SRPBCC family protein [Brucellaceae bacterium]